MGKLSLQHVCNLIYAFCRFKFTTPSFLPAVVAGAEGAVPRAVQCHEWDVTWWRVAPLTWLLHLLHALCAQR